MSFFAMMTLCYAINDSASQCEISRVLNKEHTTESQCEDYVKEYNKLFPFNFSSQMAKQGKLVHDLKTKYECVDNTAALNYLKNWGYDKLM
ncbi:hypothetical protein [Pseudomonas kurunegalensis]|uniref:hypothetical protein n=1 Tax=Pseudomonas kurunegalensis TaxID=485880 RepID=UPI0040274B60